MTASGTAPARARETVARVAVRGDGSSIEHLRRQRDAVMDKVGEMHRWSRLPGRRRALVKTSHDRPELMARR